jgi:hypothetical protein
MRKLLLYGLGGGWGHFNRMLALGQRAANDYQVTLLTNSPYACYGQEEVAKTSCQVVKISSHLNWQESCQQVREILKAVDYDGLIIDTFPRGLGGELAAVLPKSSACRILVHRELNPYYVAEKELIFFVQDNYDLVVIPGEGDRLPFASLPLVQYTQPWLIRNPSELVPPQKIHSFLCLNEQERQQKLVLVIASGNPEELSFYGSLTGLITQYYPHLAVRCLSPVLPPHCPRSNWRFHYPAMDCLPAATVAIGSGGYNTIYECLALDVPLLAIPWRRLYDRQSVRIERLQARAKIVPVFQMNDILEILGSLPARTLVIPNYTNGVEQAVRLIGKLIN